MQEQKYLQEDEIDLREIFKTIWNSRMFIILFTFIVTISSIIYVYFKNPIPIYQGNVYIEIGKIHSESIGVGGMLDLSEDLAEILKLRFNAVVEIPKKTESILKISYTDTNKEIIKTKLESVLTYILTRHQEKAKFYKNVTMTQQIGNILINDEPINKPKKKLIVSVSFVTGFILSIFIIFFMQFIQGLKKEEN